jgi:hypothetical protein
MPLAVRGAVLCALFARRLRAGRSTAAETPTVELVAAEPDVRAAPELAHVEALVYELLDAHADTVLLADELADDPDWSAHLDYLRALQREGRSLLTQLVLDEAA